jgi:hypothetical protein
LKTKVLKTQMNGSHNCPYVYLAPVRQMLGRLLGLLLFLFVFTVYGVAAAENTLPINPASTRIDLAAASWLLEDAGDYSAPPLTKRQSSPIISHRSN